MKFLRLERYTKIWSPAKSSFIKKKIVPGPWNQKFQKTRKDSFSFFTQKKKNFKKSLLYYYYLQTYLTNNIKFSYTDIRLLKNFLTPFGKIKSRRKTHITIQQQKKLGKLIRRARIEKLIPFMEPIVLKTPIFRK